MVLQVLAFSFWSFLRLATLSGSYSRLRQPCAVHLFELLVPRMPKPSTDSEAGKLASGSGLAKSKKLDENCINSWLNRPGRRFRSSSSSNLNSCNGSLVIEL